MQQDKVTEEEFRILVRWLISGGVTFVQAVYSLIDQLTAQRDTVDNIEHACRRGCSFCCHQLVTCTEIEWREIHRYLKEHATRTSRVFLNKARDRWRKYYALNQSTIRFHPRKPVADWWGKPCVFLGRDGACTIYPVRPIDCRTLVAPFTCTSERSAGKKMRHPWERWANNMILEEQGRRVGTAPEVTGVVPLPHWLCVDTGQPQRVR